MVLPQSPGETRPLLPRVLCSLEIPPAGVAAPAIPPPGCEPSPQKSEGDRASCEFKDGVRGESKVCI